MRPEPIHEWEADGRRYTAYYDEHYETRGSYAYDTPEETKAAEDEELASLGSGKWQVVGIVTSELKPTPPHCSTCTCVQPDSWQETDSCWGIVIEDGRKAIEEFARNM
jgi:hypothetical protein